MGTQAYWLLAMFKFSKFKFIQLILLLNLPILILFIGIISIPIEISNSTWIFKKEKLLLNKNKVSSNYGAT